MADDIAAVILRECSTSESAQWIFSVSTSPGCCFMCGTWHPHLHCSSGKYHLPSTIGIAILHVRRCGVGLFQIILVFVLFSAEFLLPCNRNTISVLKETVCFLCKKLIRNNFNQQPSFWGYQWRLHVCWTRAKNVQFPTRRIICISSFWLVFLQLTLSFLSNLWGQHDFFCQMVKVFLKSKMLKKVLDSFEELSKYMMFHLYLLQYQTMVTDLILRHIHQISQSSF